MISAYTKDILRTIKNNGKRFIALMIITALGLTAFAGIYAACRDYYISADRFYDEQHLFDVRILSTLGLTEDDVVALQGLDNVEKADGSFRKMAHTTINDAERAAEVVMISPKGINAPYVLEGIMPRGTGEIAVNKKYLTDSGKQIGDTLTMKEVLGDEEDPAFKQETFTITASVTNPMYIANAEGTAAFRFITASPYTFFVLPTDIDTDIYTSIFLTLKDVAQLECYSPAYKASVSNAIDEINNHIKSQREKARYDAIMSEATDKLNDAETEMNDELAEAEVEIADAWAEIEKAKEELTDGTATLTKEEKDAWQKIADGKNELKNGKTKLENSERELKAGTDELNANIAKAKDGQAKLDKQKAAAKTGFADAEKKLNAAQTQLTQQASALPTTDELAAPLVAVGQPWPQSQWDALVNQAASTAASQLRTNPQLDAATLGGAVAGATTSQQNDLSVALQAAAMPIMAVNPDFDLAAYIGNCVQAGIGTGIVKGSQTALDEQLNAYRAERKAAEKKLNAAQSELDKGFAQIEAAQIELHNGQAQIDKGWAEYHNGVKKLADEEAKAKKELDDAWAEIADGKKELADGQAELLENEKEYREKRSDAERELFDAYAELDDIDMTKWYVQDRTAIDSYVGLDTDLISINVIGRAFPVLFLIVAILISLTTMTRMVEEERGLIGTYKALGYSNLSIGAKYIIYALAASVFGSLLGYITGFIVLPRLLFVVLDVIYVIPNTTLHFDFIYGSIGALMFIVSILIATAIVCRKEVQRVPASLMRPKTPKMGARIFLERITFIWQRLKFINKITARNIFRYKKRLIMTVFGVACCTALVLTGFAIRDSVIDLMPKQYDEIDRYEILAIAEPGDEDKLTKRLSNDPEISDFLPYQTYSVKLFNTENKSDNIYLMVFPDGSDINNYINIIDLKGNPLPFNDEGVYVTQNTAELLSLNSGDQVVLQDLLLDQYDTSIQGVAENYLGNNLYITETLFESLIGEFKPNAAYAHFTGDSESQKAYAKKLGAEDYIIAAYSTEANKEQFSSDFAIINFVIYILIVLAACLAFVVLFTLASTNVSERMRELATIKVLGFYDREVYSYVNKETLLLTVISVLVGMPLGYLLSGLLLGSLKMPSIQFVLIIRPQSYLIAGVISFSFTLVVNLITNRMLNKINMVEALKSVE